MIHQTQVAPSKASATERPRPRPVAQRRCACGGIVGPSGECAACKQRRLTLQTKLTINQPGDRYEQEAERIAESVVTSSGNHPIAHSKPQIQRHTGSASAHPTTAPASVDRALGESSQHLPSGLRCEMEQRLGHDFAKVKVHTGPVAAQSAREVNAHAYTVGSDIVFATGQFAPESHDGRRLLAHELVHVAQQTAPAAPRMVQRDAVAGAQDPWDKLHPDDRAEVEELYEEGASRIRILIHAQKAHYSGRRADWLNRFTAILGKIGALDSDMEIDEVGGSLQRYGRFVDRIVDGFRPEWVAVEKRYKDERQWLLSRAARSTDSTEAVNYLDDLYKESRGWLDRGAIFYITDEDYLTLKLVLDEKRHLWLGNLRGARIRGKLLHEMLDAVADLRRDGEDPEKYIPGWSERVNQETAALQSAAESVTATKGSVRQYAGQFTELHSDLLAAKQRALDAHPREVSTLEKAGSFVSGAVGSVVGIFVEAAKQVVDLVQIVMHFGSLGHYKPKFVSDMAAAAEQGADTADLLKGMVTGLVETPARFLKAVKAGDWKAIGEETVNLYMLAKAIKQSPQAVKNLGDLAAQTHHGLRVLRARKVALEIMSEPRMAPIAPPTKPPPLPPAPTILTTPTKRPIGYDLGTPAKPPSIAPTKKRQIGFRKDGGEPAPEVLKPDLQYPSRPVSGFGRPLEPTPPPVSPPPQGLVYTEMPRARIVSSGQTGYGQVTPAMKGQRVGEPTQASASKDPPGDAPKLDQPSTTQSSTKSKDVAEKGVVTRDRNEPDRYTAKEYFRGDTNAGGKAQPRYHADVQLGADGIMKADFVLRGETGFRSGSLFGRDEFMNAIKYFEKNNGPGTVKGVRSDWGHGDNLRIFNEKFNAAKGRGLSDDAAKLEAARGTKTGEWAAEAQFKNVKIVRAEGPAGAFTDVEVVFTK